MKKFCLVVAGIFLSIFASTAQEVDSAAYRSKKLNLEEANLVSSYYQQNGDHASVTGGIGTQKLTDIANIIDVKLYKYDKKGHKHQFGAELGIDHYSSASSDMIDLKANSSASHADIRIYPSLSWTMDNEKKNYSVGLNASYSHEYDYQSRGIGIDFSKQSKNKNTEIAFKGKVYLDQVSLVYPTELRSSTNVRGDQYATTPRNSYSGSLTLSQVVNQRFQVMLIAELVRQTGYLSLPFHRVYFTDGSVHTELLPSSRLKIPIGVRANYFLGDKVVLRGFYRFYHDDWGLNANSAEFEAAYKVTPFFSVVPFYRFYQQSGADYFKPYAATHMAADIYYTSNYDLSSFSSHFFGAGLRFSTPGGVLGIQHFNMLEIRYGHYNRTDGLNSNIVSLHLKFK